MKRGISVCVLLLAALCVNSLAALFPAAPPVTKEYVITRQELRFDYDGSMQVTAHGKGPCTIGMETTLALPECSGVVLPAAAREQILDRVTADTPDLHGALAQTGRAAFPVPDGKIGCVMFVPLVVYVEGEVITYDGAAERSRTEFAVNLPTAWGGYADGIYYLETA